MATDHKYGYTGAGQTFIVPQSGGGRYDVIAYGALGGSSPGFAGGAGAESGGYFNLTPGERLRFVVGGEGAGSINGAAAGGGGGSFVLASTDGGSSYHLLLAAGGGGGAGRFSAGGDGQTTSGTNFGQGGRGGAYNSGGYYGYIGGPTYYFGYNGGGGSGYKSAGGNGAGTLSGYGGSGSSGGAGNSGFRSNPFFPVPPAAPYGGAGGYGGGGGAGVDGGGGGGGYSGGAGGYGAFGSPRSGGGGGYSRDTGTPIDAQTVAGENRGDGYILLRSAAVCFVAGTLIRTSQGDVEVGTLKVGDTLITGSGEKRPIRWLGHRTVDCRRHADPQAVLPVCISAHAFGPNRPMRDLYVSPGHAICVDVVGEVLIPAIALVNGATIAQVEVDEVTYWHVELDSHDILLAENLAAESYLDLGNRAFFAEHDVVCLDTSPDADPALRIHADYCRPFHLSGPLVEVVRAKMQAWALASGWRLSAGASDDLRALQGDAGFAPALDQDRRSAA